MSTTPAAASTAELEAERDFLLRSIDDLEAERDAGDIDDASFIDLRDSYVARTAAVLRALEGQGKARRGTETSSTAAAPPARVQKFKGPLVVVTVASVVGLLVWALIGSSSSRAPGEAITGEVALTPTQQAVTGNSQAQALFASGQLDAALAAFDEVLATDPNNVEAITYRGWLLYQVGSQSNELTITDAAAQQLALANQLVPTYPDAWAFRGVVLLRTYDDPVGAAVAMRTYLGLVPPGGQADIPLDLVTAVLQDALDQAAARNLSVPAVAGSPLP
jgi:tetratricopeptide (TPR) repeat protein